MSADTLAPDGAAVTLSPGADTGGHPFSFLGYAAVPGSDEIVALTASRIAGGGSNVFEITAAGYSLTGALQFQTVLVDVNHSQFPEGIDSPVMAALANGDVAIAWHQVDGLSEAGDEHNAFAIVAPSGATGGADLANSAGGVFFPIQGAPVLYATATGFTMAWNAETSPFAASPSNPEQYGYQVQAFDFAGQPQQGSSTPEPGWGQTISVPPVQDVPHALAAGASGSLQVSDNTAQFWAGTTFHDPVTLPGEPAHAITDEAAAMLTGGQAVVGWVDSGTDYVALFDPATNSFGPSIGLDWGGASDIQVAGLPDGGFAVSWQNGGAYKGEVFDSAGNGGGVIALAGDVAGVDSHGDLYTVALDSSGQYQVQTYAISGGSSSGGGSTGQTFTSDNNGDVWIGTPGDDTFNLGRGGDWVTGNGGDDAFKFAEIPWAGGHITDFNAGDVLDLTGLMSTTTDTGSDGFADGYLRITSDSSGDAQVWADYHIPGNDGWWLVETLDGVSASSLTHTGDAITVGSSGLPPPPPAAVSTSDATYTAPASVDSITLTGSNQTVTANNAQDTTIWSNNTGNVLNGGAGDDVIHIGRGGDWVTGGAGRDLFVFGDIPWAAATITDLDAGQGDSIDVSGILARAGYTGADPIADGYLKIVNSASNASQIWANYNLPGNDGWWLVATVHDDTGSLPLGPLQYAGNGVIDQVGEHAGGTFTTNGQLAGAPGYDTFIMTGSNSVVAANDGGDHLVDQGANNEMFGGKGNDTFVLGTSTTIATDSWGGVNTWLLNPQSTVVTHSTDALTSGDRLGVLALLATSHYTGSDPVGDGYVFMAPAPPPAAGELGDFVASQLMYDPDGAAGPQAARPLFDTYYTRPDQFHYADGFFVVQ